MTCPNCGAKVDARATLCPECGNELRPAREMRCPGCGATVREGTKACIVCGTSLVGHRSSFTFLIETAVVLSVIGVLLGGVWLLRSGPNIAAVLAQPPTDVPTSTRTPTRTPTTTPTPLPTITSTPPPAVLVHTIQSGDTLTAIAAQYGATIEAIMAANGLTDANQLLSVGKQLRIPLAAGVPTPGPTAVPPTPAPPATYTVKEGDTIEGIAGRFNVSSNDLLAANNLKPDDFIRPGDVLKLPGAAPVPPTATPTKPTATPPPTATAGIRTAQPPRATSAFPYATPSLLEPVNGTTFRGADASIVLQWTSVGILAADEYYVVRLRISGADGGVTDAREEWTRTTSWRVPSNLKPDPKKGALKFQWDVTVRRQTGKSAQGVPQGTPISPQGETRSFTWEP